ncbi:lactate utilization protein C, partial [Dickeya dianthicola]|nr:lactate utilization protein C [Dickeya dianthicola]
MVQTASTPDQGETLMENRDALLSNLARRL